MFKLIKYELRANLYTILGICITVICANLLLLTRKNSWPIPGIAGLSAFLSVSAGITIFIYSLTIMGKYLYEDTGYLLFTLPQSGFSILTSRLITSLIQISAVILVCGLSSFLIFADKTVLNNIIKFIHVKPIVISIIFFICSLVYFITFVYFCMILGKVAFKNKKIGKLGSFIVFIILSIVLSWISSKLISIFPQSITLWNFPIAPSFTANESNINLSVSATNGCTINIADLIKELITFCIFFFSSSYFLDKKVEL